MPPISVLIKPSSLYGAKLLKEEHDKCKAVGKPSGNCMDSAAWTLIFLVPAKYVAKDTFKGVSL